MPKNKKMSDSAILARVNTAVRDSVGFRDSELAKERRTVKQYYDAVQPYPTSRRNSKYVSQDVYDSVEAAKAAILEPFLGDRSIGSFAPQGDDDVQLAQIATEYVNYVLFRQNDAEGVFQTVVDEGLNNRTSVAKVYWDEQEERYEELFEDLPDAAVDILLAEDDAIEVTEMLEDEDTGLFSGSILKTRTVKQARLIALPPEEFGISSKAKSIEDADFSYHRERKTQAELRAMGLTEEQLRRTGDDNDWEEDPEVTTRFDGIGGDRVDENPLNDEALDKAWLYEMYTKMDIRGDGFPRLWKITFTSGAILDKEEVRDHPFISYSPLPRSHSFYGNSFAARVIPTQNAKTALTRGIIDHTVESNNQKFMVTKGTVQKPAELLDDRFGGIVNVNRPDGINPFPQARLNPFVFQTIGLLDTDLEDTTGVSKVSQGLNKDAISKQNSADLISQLTSLSQMRLKIMARNFIRQFVIPLYVKTYGLIIENEDAGKVINVAGDFVQVDPTDWKERVDFTVDIQVGHGEAEKAAADWREMDAYLSQTAGPMYGAEQKFAVLSQMFQEKGIKGMQRFVKSPADIPPPEPDPLALKDMELRERELVVREKQVAIQEMEAKVKAQDAEIKAALQGRRDEADFAIKSDAQDLAERKQQHAEEVAEEELRLINREGQESKGIISPNS